jgi:hypothetical protein
MEISMWKIKWDASPEATVQTIDELDRQLDRLQQDCIAAPVLATVELLSSGDSLSIGLGRAESVLNFVSGSGDPPYWSSVGERKEDDAVGFNFMGELSEIPLRHLIPIDMARQAVRDFVQSGKLSARVKWEES